MATFISHVEWQWNPAMGMYDCIPHYRMTRSMPFMPEKKDETPKKAPGIPEVPGEDHVTHGGSGAPPSVDPDVADLLESGKDLYVDGQNRLREVEPDNN